MIARGLINLGFEPGKDFIAQDDGAGPFLKAWLSPQPQPTDQAIADAAAKPHPEEARLETFKSDANTADLITRLRTANAAQIDTFVDATKSRGTVPSKE
jgi:hypothetical protein